MATRGTGYLLLDKDCVSTTEFNGDMYPEGHGDRFYEGISEVSSEMDFIDFVEKFNGDTFNYEEDLIYSIINSKFYDNEERMLIDFNNEYFKRFFSDWIFFKNLSGLSVKFITREGIEIIVPHGKSCRFNFGDI